MGVVKFPGKGLTLDAQVTVTGTTQAALGRFDNGTNSTFLEFSRTGFTERGTVGALGGFEMNLSYNMDYTTNVHRLYDQTKSATWFSITDGSTSLQYAPATAASGDVWSAGGNLYNVYIDSASGNANFRGGIGIGAGMASLRYDSSLYITGNFMAGANQVGVKAIPTFSSTATGSGIAGFFQAGTDIAAFTCTETYGVQIGTTLLGAGSTITTNYGLFIAAQTVGATNYAIYTAGTTPSLFNGEIGAASQIRFTGNTSLTAAGTIGRQSTTGFTVWSSTGSVNDFQIYNAAGTVAALAMPTGTANWTMGGTLTISGHGTTASAANCYIDAGTGLISRSTSSKRYKTDIRPMTLAAARRVVRALRPVTYRSTAPVDDKRRSHLGLVAEQVAAVDPRLVHRLNGKPDGVMYDRLIVPLLTVIQDQERRLAALERAA